ncbi:hypothetical protein [Aeoliella sp.]|uniref:hypothetical protein n=1 Tax=Aeoliella sp. TaxID=2795800 RepID=UPI003CCB9E21
MIYSKVRLPQTEAAAAAFEKVARQYCLVAAREPNEVLYLIPSEALEQLGVTYDLVEANLPAPLSPDGQPLATGTTRMWMPPCLLLRRKDGQAFDLETWRSIASACGAEITDQYEAINPFTQGPMHVQKPGSGRWERDGQTLHLLFRGEDVHIRHPCDIRDRQLNHLALLLDADLIPEDTSEQWQREREKRSDC